MRHSTGRLVPPGSRGSVRPVTRPPAKGRTNRLNIQQCCTFLGALAEPERLRIVQSLLEGPKTVGEVCQLLASPVANTSHHLKQLRAAGLVQGTKRGRFVIYSLTPDVFRPPAGAATTNDVLDFGCCQLDFGGAGDPPKPAPKARAKPTGRPRRSPASPSSADRAAR
jgi:DNA-binding transcriptional ArsR family regulator